MVFQGIHSRRCFLADNTEENDGGGNDLNYSKLLYKETSKRLDKAYIILITFILFFFFALYLPYTFLEHKIETSAIDVVIANMSQLYNSSLGQENISRSIQNEIDNLIIPAKDDYKQLDQYYRKLELLESKANLTSSNLSVNELESISPTFFICNRHFHSNITHWVSCNAKFVADGINNKTLLRYHELGRQVEPLMRKIQYNLQDIHYITSALINLSKTGTQFPAGIKHGQWKSILNTVSLINTRANSSAIYDENVVKLLNRSNEADLWTLLNYGGLNVHHNLNSLNNLADAIRALNQSKNQELQQLKDLSTKFEGMELPVIGKVPVGLANAVLAFPSAVGIGALICSYYLGQTISKRLVFHKEFCKKDPKGSFNGELYPVWVDPLDRNLFQYGRLVLFVSLPLVILLLITVLSLTGPANQGYTVGLTFLDVPEYTVLAWGTLMGLVLIGLGIFIVIKESEDYKTFLKSKKKC